MGTTSTADDVQTVQCSTLYLERFDSLVMADAGYMSITDDLVDMEMKCVVMIPTVGEYQW